MFWTDQTGVFEMQPAPDNASRLVLAQRVLQQPVIWHGRAQKEPMTLLAAENWTDVTVSIRFWLPPQTSEQPLLLQAHKVRLCLRLQPYDGKHSGGEGWGVCFSVHPRPANRTQWNVTTSARADSSGTKFVTLAQGSLVSPSDFVAGWHSMSFTTKGSAVHASVDGRQVHDQQVAVPATFRRGGFVSFGCGFHAAYFDSIAITRAL